MEKMNRLTLFRDGFYRGIGWAFGVTIGFALVSTLLVLLFQMLGGLPLIGDFFASIVEATQESLLKRSIFIPRY